MLFNHSRIIDHILDNLFEPDARRLKLLITELIQKNNEMTGIQADGLMYQGTWHPNPETGSTPKSPRILAHEGIIPDMEVYARQELALYNERMRLKQGLHQVLKNCENTQDIRDALPESLMNLPYLTEVSRLPRTRPEGYTLAHSERGQRQFGEIIDRLKYYSVAGLFY